MKFILVFLSLLLPFIAATSNIEVDEGVLVLTDDNFQSALAEHKQILVEFYAPWCGHCKSLAPEYAKAAKALSAASSSVKLAKVDATENKKVASDFHVQGFPTLKWFKNGKDSEYNGGRTESEIVSWINKKVGPVSTTISSDAELEKLRESHDAVALGVFAKPDSPAAKQFLSVAENDDAHVFAITYDASVRSKLGVSGDDAIVVLKSFDDLRADLPVTSSTSDEEISRFITGNTTPLIQEFSQENSKKIFSSPITQHVLFFTDKSASHHASTVDTFKEVATAYKGRLLFVNVPSTEQRILDFFEIKATDVPAVVLADLGAESGLKKYPFSGELSASSVTSFIDSFIAGTLVPHLKSEEIAPEDTSGDVTILKGKSFRDLVINNDKDAFVEFYAPWCGHCKKLAPIWDELGAHFAGHKDKIVIAKMDSTANEIDFSGVSVKGFPTLYFFKGDDKSHPVKYEGGRELDDLIEYAEKNSFHKAAIAGGDKDEL